MTLNTYLFFNGNCREAFEFYRSVFGGEFVTLQTFGDGPADMQIPDGEREHIMHASFPIGTSILMGSDVPSTSGHPVNTGNNFSISYLSGSREETDGLFAKLSEGGNVTMPLTDTFWGAYFGSCTDKFGINWQLNYDQ